jgi:hypothetical protein
MTLTELLESLGDRLGILEKAEQTSPKTAVVIKTRSVTLTELTAEIHADNVRSLSESPAELSIPFEKIFESAGVAPGSHGWTIERLRQLLQTDAFKKLGREAAQEQLIGMLSAEQVSPEDMVKDAVARDKALDAFEGFARKKMEDREAARERKMAEVESRIQELRKESENLKAQAKAEEEKWKDWRRRKRQQEHDLAWTVGFLIDRPVITTDEDD